LENRLTPTPSLFSARGQIKKRGMIFRIEFEELIEVSTLFTHPYPLSFLCQMAD
jgi:hypothetical protein